MLFRSGKRPLSTMTPTMVLKGGKLWLVLGSPGGPTIVTTVANVLLGVADYGLNIKQEHAEFDPARRANAPPVETTRRNRPRKRSRAAAGRK